VTGWRAMASGRIPRKALARRGLPEESRMTRIIDACTDLQVATVGECARRATHEHETHGGGEVFRPLDP
jgi:hypothetical protein